MDDLVWGLVGMGLLSAMVCGVTIASTRKLSNRTTTWVGIAAACVMLLYLTLLWGRSALVQIFPSTAIIIWGNWFLPAAAFLAGITWTHGYGTRSRRIMLATAVLLIAGYSLIEPLLGETPRCRDAWVGRVCVQTSPDTCSPAAAATLLAQYGIAAEESEMAELCLTRVGTMWQGLYRGLRIKLLDHPYEVEVFECSVDELLDGFSGPQILAVGITADRAESNFYIDELGWSPGVRHSVVLLDKLPDGLFLMADPSVGYEFWSRDDLEVLWLGRGLRIRRHPSIETQVQSESGFHHDRKSSETTRAS